MKIKTFLKEYRDEIHRSAAEMLRTAMPDVTEELFAEFEHTGERIGYEKVYFTRRKYLAILGMEAILRVRDERNCRMNFRGEYGTGADGISDEKAGAEKDRVCGRKTEGKTEPDFCVNSEEAEEKQGPEELMKKFCAIVESVCAEETWALPAHVNRKAENWQVTVDLFASETAQTLANLMDELWEELPAPLVHRMQEEICRRVLDPFFGSGVPYSWWEGSEMNWNAVCAGAIGSVCIHFHNRGLALPAEFPACIRRICSSLTHYIDGFAEDGACMEGLGYYTYGMAFYVNFMRELEEALQTEKLRRIAEFPGKCFFSDGRSLSFSDGDSRDTWRVGIWCALSAWFDGLPLPNLKSAAGVHADSCYRFVNLKMDIFETEKYLSRAKENEKPQRNCQEPDVAKKQEVRNPENGDGASRRTAQADRSRGRADILPDAQWCIAESENGVGFACKGGHNDEPHNHNDIGHFIYEAGGTMFLTDLGAGEYTADYFSAKRYQILCNSSAGHSVPVLNGENQRCGREYRCGEFTAHVGEMPENTIEQILYVQMGIGSAWPWKKGSPAPSASVQRTFHFDLQTGGLEIEDTFDRTQWGSVTETLITQIPPQVEDNKIYLRGDSGVVAISVQNTGEEQGKSEHLNHNVISEKKENLNTEAGGKTPEMREESPKIRVRRYEHRNHVGEAETVYAICWDVSGSHTFICLQKTVNDA